MLTRAIAARNTSGSSGGIADPASWRMQVLLSGPYDGVERSYSTPESFIHVAGGFSIALFHNGRRLPYSTTGSPADGAFYVVESGGVGTGFDTVVLIRFAPNDRSILTADYVAA